MQPNNRFRMQQIPKRQSIVLIYFKKLLQTSKDFPVNEGKIIGTGLTILSGTHPGVLPAIRSTPRDRTTPAEKLPKWSRCNFQRQAKTIFAEKVNGIVSAKEMQKTVIHEITAKAAAGPWSIVINFTSVFAVPVLKENAPLIIRMNHIQSVTIPGPGNCRLQVTFPDVFHTDIHPDMSPHLGYELGFIRLHNYFPVPLAAGAALAALVKNGFQGIFIDLTTVHEHSLLQYPPGLQRMIL
jgi:hypothetical protein